MRPMSRSRRVSSPEYARRKVRQQASEHQKKRCRRRRAFLSYEFITANLKGKVQGRLLITPRSVRAGKPASRCGRAGPGRAGHGRAGQGRADKDQLRPSSSRLDREAWRAESGASVTSGRSSLVGSIALLELKRKKSPAMIMLRVWCSADAMLLNHVEEMNGQMDVAIEGVPVGTTTSHARLCCTLRSYPHDLQSMPES